MKIIKYKGTITKGSVGDFETEWWTDEDWKKHKEYIEELKTSGEFGKEVNIELNLVEYPLFDKDILPTKVAMESYRMILLDLSDMT